MKSLSTSIINLIHNWQQMKGLISTITDNSSDFPVNLEGINQGIFPFFTHDFLKAANIKNLQYLQYHGQNNQQDDYNTISNDLVIVVPSDYEAGNIYNDLSTVLDENTQIIIFPSWGLIPYRAAAPGSVVFGQRAGVLSKLADHDILNTINNKNRIFIITQKSFISFLPPPQYLNQFIIKMKKGDSINTTSISEKLTLTGYNRVSRVSVKGEFSLRGEVLDIFLPLDENPTRIIFDFDEITNIKIFDYDTQTTLYSKDFIEIYPMKEIIWTDEFINTVEQKLHQYQESSINNNDTIENPEHVHLPFTEEAMNYLSHAIDELRTKKNTEGEEFFYQFIFDKNYTIADYLSPDSYVFFYDYDRLLNGELAINREYNGMYRKARETLPVLPPDLILNPLNDTIQNIKKSIFFRTINQPDSLKIDTEVSRSFFGNINFLKEELTNLQNDNWNVFIYTDNENQSSRINEIFKDYTQCENKNPVKLIPQSLSQGFSIPEIKLMVIQENEIFGRRKYVSKSVTKAKSKAIDTFVELSPGDYVVHVNWGIGLFHGIERVKSMGNERDYIKLEYADKEYAFVPIEQVNLIQRYIGSEGENPKVDRIGSKSWENRKEKAKKAVEDIAQKLISLYSRRKASVGFAFPKETEWQSAFEAAFPYQDTPDQITVTEEIKNDMEKPVPMDRLVCGDVGYGKTEIAMRAAFKAVMGGKQVAFLAPTTILAEQHYDNCIERFKNFPVKIARLSRFVSPAEKKKILQKVSEGAIDILVGTHRIIQKDVIFKNLGLMIIDEEQRFGVKDKEKLKEMKNNIDCLTMSATPIPRTLHMSLLKIRDMSLLTTPPQNRQPIETIIDEYTEERIAKAIRTEMDRGGQIFYLHNRVESLMEIRTRIEKIVPECIVDIAHGQMTSNELDDIFHRFKMGAFNVLIATTIIENGIDIPNVNTIIIDRADMYGVSQLYQLRGRVGRSERKAYAYLLYPENKALSEVAMKRLQVISDFTELGSGFKIAMKDMEIRGAGNLLGKDQSGDVYAVGFDLYLKLLDEAVNRLMLQEDYKAQTEVLMELEYTGFIPDTYVTVPQIKMEIYKKIASIITDQELDSVLSELTDRFGPIPDEVSSLLALAEIRIICKKLEIASVKERKGEVRIEFSSVAKISVDKFMKLIQENPGTIRLNSAEPNCVYIKLGQIGLKEKSEFIREKLSKLV